MSKMKVEVAYALPDRQKILVVEVEATTTIEQAINLSGILTLFPEINLENQAIGVFGKLRKLSDSLKEGDRVEIYRPLAMDPKVARRMRTRESRK